MPDLHLQGMGRSGQPVGSYFPAAGTGPDSVSGLNLWLEARFISGGVDGGQIGNWLDQSGNNNTGTPHSSGSFPIYRSNVIGGQPAVEFITDSPWLTFPDFCSGFSAGEIFMLGKATADPPPDGGTAGMLDFDNADFEGFYPYSDGVIYEAFGTTVRKTVGDPALSLASYRLYDVRSAASDFEAYLNTTSLFSTGTNTVGFTTTPKFARNSGGNPWSGTMAMLLMYNRGLTSGERTTIRSYATSIYGVP